MTRGSTALVHMDYSGWGSRISLSLWIYTCGVILILSLECKKHGRLLLASLPGPCTHTDCKEQRGDLTVTRCGLYTYLIRGWFLKTEDLHLLDIHRSLSLGIKLVLWASVKLWNVMWSKGHFPELWTLQG